MSSYPSSTELSPSGASTPISAPPPPDDSGTGEADNRSVRTGIRVLAFLAFALSACTPTANPQQNPQPTATTLAGSPTSTVSASASPTPRPTDSPVAFENPFLGYRIALPQTYRRLTARYFTAGSVPGGLVGADAYTLLTEQQQREECLQDQGDLPPQSANLGLFVEAYRVDPAVTASAWASTPRVSGAQPLATHRRIQPLAVPGYDAIKLVADNASAETQVVVIHAGDWTYVISPTMWPSPHRLEDIASTFTTIARQPVPTPSPAPAPDVARAAASALAASLGAAFTARDATAVARLMEECRIYASPVIDGTAGLPNSGGGGLGRSVALFTQALRDRFAAGDLSVTVAPNVELDANGAYFVRSEWKEPDRTVRIDLVLRLQDGQWRWTEARHYYSRADLGSQPCIPYRSPWVGSGVRC